MNLNIALLLLVLAGGVGGMAGVQAMLGRSANRPGHTHEVSVRSLV